MPKWYRLAMADMEMEMEEKTKELAELKKQFNDPNISPEKRSELQEEIKKKAHARRLLGCRIHYRLHGKTVSNQIYNNELKQKNYKEQLKKNLLTAKARDRVKKKLQQLQVAHSELKKKEDKPRSVTDQNPTLDI